MKKLNMDADVAVNAASAHEKYLAESRAERVRGLLDRRDHSLVGFPHGAKRYVFSVSQDGEGWSYSAGGLLRASGMTKGDAIREACHQARIEEASGHACHVLVTPGETPVNHYEPFLDE